MPLLTYPQAAEYLGGVHVTTLRRWVRAGKIPVLHLGPRVTRFDQRDLDRHLAEAKRRRPAVPTR